LATWLSALVAPSGSVVSPGRSRHISGTAVGWFFSDRAPWAPPTDLAAAGSCLWRRCVCDCGAYWVAPALCDLGACSGCPFAAAVSSFCRLPPCFQSVSRLVAKASLASLPRRPSVRRRLPGADDLILQVRFAPRARPVVSPRTCRPLLSLSSASSRFLLFQTRRPGARGCGSGCLGAARRLPAFGQQHQFFTGARLRALAHPFLRFLQPFDLTGCTSPFFHHGSRPVVVC